MLQKVNVSSGYEPVFILGYVTSSASEAYTILSGFEVGKTKTTDIFTMKNNWIYFQDMNSNSKYSVKIYIKY